MRTIYPLLVVMALGLAVMVVNLSGFAAVTGVSTDPGLQADSALNDSVGDHNVSKGFNGSADSSDDSDIVGVILAGGSAIFDILGMVVLLPWELENLGLPRAFAYPVGVAGQLLAVIGGIQLVMGRVLE